MTQKVGSNRPACGFSVAPAQSGRGTLAAQGHAELEGVIRNLRQRKRRLARVEVDDRPVWIRMARAKSLRVQISKGLPRRLLAREGRLLRAMAARGAPVPAVLAQGPDYLVLADCGRVLMDLVAERQDAGSRADLMQSVGEALARLHLLGCTHGRPYVRDILVAADGTITFTDMERGARIDAPGRFQIRDLALLVLSIYARWPKDTADRLIDPLLTAYMARMPPERPAQVAHWTRSWRWLAILSAPARWRERNYRKAKVWKEYQALPLTLDRLAKCVAR
jgi:tRNA A-37 threonylcarbamoyl transferase component Bud32